MKLSPVALLALILLSGCAGKADLDPVCPQTGFIGRTDTITYFAPGSKDIAAVGTIKGFSGECVFKDKHSDMVEIDLTLPFTLQKGKAAGDLKGETLPYFIGILSPTEEILQRKAFTTKVVFDNDTGVGTSTEEHVLKIPLKSRADIEKYKVIIGFALTRDQLKYNEDTNKPEEPQK